ncbi:MAG: hypothetical protein ACIALR_06230, partial [Blastopirellula sp. JB062]
MKNLYLRFTAIGGVASLGVAAIVQSVLSSAQTAGQPVIDAAQEQVAAMVESSTTPSEDGSSYVPPIVRANNENDEPAKPAPNSPPPPASHRFSLGDKAAAPVSRYLGDSGSASDDASEPKQPASAPVTAGDSPQPPVSRFSLGDSAAPSSAATSPAATETPAKPAAVPTPAKSRFQIGDAAPAAAAAIGAAAAAVASEAAPSPKYGSRFGSNPSGDAPAPAGEPAEMSSESPSPAAAETSQPKPASVAETPAPNPSNAPAATSPTANAATPPSSSRFQFSSSGGNSTPVSSNPAPVGDMPAETAASERYPAPASIDGVAPVTPNNYPTPRSMPSYGGNELPGGNAPAISGIGKPGDAKLEGLQQPAITLEKQAPVEIQVGKATTFSLVVKNVGQTTAHDVVIRDSVPAGTALISTTPTAEGSTDGQMLWKIGQIAPGEEKRLTMELMPQTEGDVGSVATVSFAAHATVRSRVTKPELTIEQTAAPTVLIGDNLLLAITVSNPGTGPATGVVLEEVVPANFTHPAGSELEFEIGTLKPGETRSLELTLKADKAGRTKNVLGIRGDGNLQTQTELNVEVIAPQLEISMVGPKLRYLDRPAKYQVSVSNPGTAPAQSIDLITYLPKGMKFVDANNAGQYDSSQHAVFWNLAELPPSQSGAVELTALPIEAGDQKIRVEGSARMGLSAQNETLVQVEGIVALFFEVVDQADPIELGKDT